MGPFVFREAKKFGQFQGYISFILNQCFDLYTKDTFVAQLVETSDHLWLQFAIDLYFWSILMPLNLTEHFVVKAPSEARRDNFAFSRLYLLFQSLFLVGGNSAERSEYFLYYLSRTKGSAIQKLDETC